MKFAPVLDPKPPRTVSAYRERKTKQKREDLHAALKAGIEKKEATSK